MANREEVETNKNDSKKKKETDLDAMIALKIELEKQIKAGLPDKDFANASSLKDALELIITATRKILEK